MKKLCKSAHCHLWQTQSKQRQSTSAHAFTEVSELFSLIRFILLVGESISYMTITQKHVVWLLSVVTFAHIDVLSGSIIGLSALTQSYHIKAWS